MINNKTKFLFFIAIICGCFIFKDSNICFLYRSWESMLINMQKASLSLITGNFQPETILTYKMQALVREAIFWLMMLIFTMSVIFNNQLNNIIQSLKDFFVGLQRSFLNHCTLNFKGGIASKCIQFSFFVVSFPMASSVHILVSAYLIVVFIAPAKIGILVGSKIPKIAN